MAYCPSFTFPVALYVNGTIPVVPMSVKFFLVPLGTLPKLSLKIICCPAVSLQHTRAFNRNTSEVAVPLVTL